MRMFEKLLEYTKTNWRTRGTLRTLVIERCANSFKICVYFKDH